LNGIRFEPELSAPLLEGATLVPLQVFSEEGKQLQIAAVCTEKHKAQG
jgi:hypothetical protein